MSSVCICEAYLCVTGAIAHQAAARSSKSHTVHLEKLPDTIIDPSYGGDEDISCIGCWSLGVSDVLTVPEGPEGLTNTAEGLTCTLPRCSGWSCR